MPCAVLVVRCMHVHVAQNEAVSTLASVLIVCGRSVCVLGARRDLSNHPLIHDSTPTLDPIHYHAQSRPPPRRLLDMHPHRCCTAHCTMPAPSTVRGRRSLPAAIYTQAAGVLHTRNLCHKGAVYVHWGGAPAACELADSQVGCLQYYTWMASTHPRLAAANAH